jgi:HK97 family phage major capsid protein
MLDDVDNFAQDVEAELVERIKLFVDDQILNGDGTGNNLTGVDANATAFAAGSVLANAVDLAQEADCLRAAIAQVVRNEFYPTYCVVHPDILAKMDLMKDATTGIYIIPPFRTADGNSISGVPVVSNTNIGVDDFYVGDFTKYRIKIREDIDIQFGYENDDWTKNLITPLAEMRLVGYIPANHYGAIVTGTFTAASAALETA